MKAATKLETSVPLPVAAVSMLPDHHCLLCESPEYETARALLQRSGLNVEQWGFLLHDITAQLRDKEFYWLEHV